MPEIEAALMSSVTTDGKYALGPVPIHEMLVSGIRMKILVDTGSPATVISLDHALDILAQDRPRYESLAQWKLAAITWVFLGSEGTGRETTELATR